MNHEILREFAINVFVALLIWWLFRRFRLQFPGLKSERYSTLSLRSCALIVDSCFAWPVGLIAAAILPVSYARTLTAFRENLMFLSWLLYRVVMHATYGQTVGKIVTNIRVVDFRTEGTVSWRQSWLREICPIVLGVSYLSWGVFFIMPTSLNPSDATNHEALIGSELFLFLADWPSFWICAQGLIALTNKKRRTIHDFLGGTVVVTQSSEG